MPHTSPPPLPVDFFIFWRSLFKRWGSINKHTRKKTPRPSVCPDISIPQKTTSSGLTRPDSLGIDEPEIHFLLTFHYSPAGTRRRCPLLNHHRVRYNNRPGKRHYSTPMQCAGTLCRVSVQYQAIDPSRQSNVLVLVTDQYLIQSTVLVGSVLISIFAERG